MKKVVLGKSGLEVPAFAVGCMRINRVDEKQAQTLVNTALEAGANFFDHADIYGRGTCEEIFAKAIDMKPSVRDKIYIQSKCGIIPGVAFDFSKQHIIASVEGSLKRLNTDYLDVLLLHRPDALVEPEEVAAAFDELYDSGKVRHFGVSNQNVWQIQLLKKYLRHDIVANQLQFSIAHCSLISEGMHVNMDEDAAAVRTGGVLDFCRLNDITVQPWSPFQYGFFEGTFLGNDNYPELNKKIAELSEKYGVSDTAVALAWLLRHPAHMQPVIGTMNPERLRECVKATEITLTREEWYAVYLAAGNTLP